MRFIQASMHTAIGKTETRMERADVLALVDESDFLLSYSVYPRTPSYRVQDALYLTYLRMALKSGAFYATYLVRKFKGLHELQVERPSHARCIDKAQVPRRILDP